MTEVETRNTPSTASLGSVPTQVQPYSSGEPRRRLTVHSLTLQKIDSDAFGVKRHYVPEGDGPINVSPSQGNQHLGASHKWVQKHTKSFCETAKNRSYSEWAETILPMYKWLRVYDLKSALPKDVIAGMTVGAMVVPQGMSYAKLAGLPVQYGLYSALVPVYAYAIFGSSRQLAVGPVALVSLLLSTGLTGVLDQKGLTQKSELYDEVYAALAFQTAFMIGIIYVVMGLLKLGFITIFLSHAVISGFTTAAAIIIALSQFKYIFGISITRSDLLHVIIKSIFQNISGFNWRTFLVGMASLSVLLYAKRIGKQYPNINWVRAAAPLVVTIIAVLSQAYWHWDQKGIPIVGHIPKGLPPLTCTYLFPLSDNIGDLMVTVVSIAIVGFMESIAIAKTLADAHNYQVDPSMELIGLGMANLAAGGFSGYPITGSFSRTAVSNESDAQSGISGVITATLVGLALLFLTPFFELMVRYYRSHQMPHFF